MPPSTSMTPTTSKTMAPSTSTTTTPSTLIPRKFEWIHVTSTPAVRFTADDTEDDDVDEGDRLINWADSILTEIAFKMMTLSDQRFLDWVHSASTMAVPAVNEPNRLLKWAHGKAAPDKSKRFSKWVHSTSTMAALVKCKRLLEWAHHTERIAAPDSIHKMLKDGIDTWAPKLPVEMVIVDYPSLDEEIHVDLFQRSAIGCTLMSILEFSKGDGILAQEILNRWFLYEERGGDVVMKGKVPFILPKTNFNNAYKDVLALCGLQILWHMQVWTGNSRLDSIRDTYTTTRLYGNVLHCDAAKLLGYTAEAVLDCVFRLAVWTFDINEMLNEEGNTFVYLLNTQAKVRRITDDSCKDINVLKKASISSFFNASELILEKEEGWEKGEERSRLYFCGPRVRLPGRSPIPALDDSCLSVFPYILCEYLHNLSKKFNRYYSSVFKASSFFALSMTQLPLRLPLSAPERPMDVKASLFHIIQCEDGSTHMYYMVLKDAVDTTLEIKFEKNTLGRELIKSMLAVPTKGSLVIKAYMEDARYGQVILKKSCIFKSQLRGCSYGTLSGWKDCSLHLKVDLTLQLHESAGSLPSLKLSLHSCSLPGSMNATQVSFWGGRLHFRKVGEQICKFGKPQGAYLQISYSAVYATKNSAICATKYSTVCAIKYYAVCATNCSAVCATEYPAVCETKIEN
ncbi:hypothetical protein Tco_0052828 [Tanacetum coccineum]